MRFDNRKLNDVVLDYDNPDKNYVLAREYDRLEQGSAAFGFYLRAADMSPGKTFEEKWLQYKCMILGSFIYDRNGNRGYSVEGLLKIAIETLPERPEAYYFLAKYKQDRDDWREALMYSAIGISQIKDCQFGMESCKVGEAPDNDVGYPGDDVLRLLYARAKWKTDGRDESKNLAFDLKYKKNLPKSVDKKATELLEMHGYPSTLAYTTDLKKNYVFRFDGIDEIKNNYSRHFQDMFVLSALDGKRNGSFVELGSGHPELFNNTKLLEENFGWKGISVDNSERLCHIFSRKRSTGIILEDASQLDYRVLFKQQCFDQRIDFLRINAERASIEALKKIPFDKHEFGVIQFQHNAVWWGSEFREESRRLLSQIGYVLLVNDVAVDPKSPYEDWWVHPLVAKSKQNMKTSKKINFAWDYMIEKTPVQWAQEMREAI